MKVLLTGGSGQVGTELRRRARGFQLLAPARAELDLADPARVAATVETLAPDLVLSVGAYTAVDRAEDEPALATRVNAEAVQALADYCRRHAAPLLHVSTDYVFDGSLERPYREDDNTHPTGVYGLSKLAGERAARSAPAHLVLRVAWVFAAHGGNFVRTMLRAAHGGAALRVVDDQIGGPTWAGHIAEALLALVERWQAQQTLPWGTYHYAGAPALTWYAFARAIFSEAVAQQLLERAPEVQPISTSPYPTRARRPANSRLDMTRTSRRLGFVAPDWREGLRATLAEIKAARN